MGTFEDGVAETKTEMLEYEVNGMLVRAQSWVKSYLTTIEKNMIVACF